MLILVKEQICFKNQFFRIVSYAVRSGFIKDFFPIIIKITQLNITAYNFHLK